MSETEQKKMLASLHKAIQQRKTGTPRDFAKALGINLGELNKTISFLKNRLKLKIRYDKIQQTFYYIEDITIKKNKSDETSQ